MICENCGKKLPKNQTICPACGKVHTIEPEQAKDIESAVGGKDEPRGFSNKRNVIIIAVAAAVLLAGGVGTAVAFNASTNSAQSVLAVAQRFLSEKNYEQAIIEFKRVLELDPTNVEAYIGLADAYIGLCEYDKADDILRKGYEITGDDEFLEKLGELGMAEEKQDLSQKQEEMNLISANPPADFHIDISETRKHTICTVEENGFTVAVKEDGTVITSGSNRSGECDLESWTDIVSVAADSSPIVVGLRADGTVVAAGDNDPAYGHDGCNVSDWEDIVDICIDNGHTYGLKSDGTVVTTCEYDDISDLRGITDIEISRNDKLICLRYDGTIETSTLVSDLRDEVSTFTNVKQAVGTGHNVVALISDGTVRIAGEDEDNIYSDVKEWTNIVELSSGWHHLVGLKADGTVVASGDNSRGECNTSEWSGINQITCGSYGTIGVKTDGTIMCAGENINLFDWSDVVQLVGDIYLGSFVGLKSDGTVASHGFYHQEEQDFHDWTDIEKLYLKSGILYAVNSDGRMRVSLGSGFLYDNEKEWIYLQENVVSFSDDFAVLHKDGNFSFLPEHLDYTGKIFPSGEFMTQDTMYEWVEQYGGEIYDVYNGYRTSVLMEDGRVYYDIIFGNYELIATDAVEIAMGGNYDSPLLILHKDGTVSVHGQNVSYYEEIVSEWTDIVHIAAASSILAALTSDGRLLTSEEGIRVYSWTGIKQH